MPNRKVWKITRIFLLALLMFELPGVVTLPAEPQADATGDILDPLGHATTGEPYISPH